MIPGFLDFVGRNPNKGKRQRQGRLELFNRILSEIVQDSQTNINQDLPVTFSESHPVTCYKPVRDLKPGDQARSLGRSRNQLFHCGLLKVSPSTSPVDFSQSSPETVSGNLCASLPSLHFELSRSNQALPPLPFPCAQFPSCERMGSHGTFSWYVENVSPEYQRREMATNTFDMVCCSFPAAQKKSMHQL